MFSKFITELSSALSEPLPGEKAQLLMGSGIRMKEFNFMQMNEKTKKSGVMILLYPKNKTIYSALIVRPEYNGTHSGQVALPGGKIEECDKDIIDTALRETSEEIGIEQLKIKVIGQLTKLYIPPSNYVVYPVIGYMDESPLFIADENEVKEIIEYPVSKLLDEEIVNIMEFKIREGVSFNAPYFNIKGNVVWGATAMILSEFKEILKKICLKSGN